MACPRSSVNTGPGGSLSPHQRHQTPEHLGVTGPDGAQPWGHDGSSQLVGHQKLAQAISKMNLWNSDVEFIDAINMEQCIFHSMGFFFCVCLIHSFDQFNWIVIYIQQNSTILRTQWVLTSIKQCHHRIRDLEQELADDRLWAKSNSHLFLFCIFLKGY